MDLHPDCVQLAFLLGTWKGAGTGDYPTIDGFSYDEEVVFEHVGKPFLAYRQKTRDAGTGAPLHAEAGYLRAVGGERVELVIAQPSGILEIHEGRADGTLLVLDLVSVHTTPSAKSVTDVRREIRVVESEGDTASLVYDLWMAAVGRTMTHHLHAELERQTDA